MSLPDVPQSRVFQFGLSSFFPLIRSGNLSPLRMFDAVDLLPKSPTPGMQPWLRSILSGVKKLNARTESDDLKTPYRQVMNQSLMMMKEKSGDEVQNHCSFVSKSLTGMPAPIPLSFSNSLNSGVQEEGKLPSETLDKNGAFALEHLQVSPMAVFENSTGQRGRRVLKRKASSKGSRVQKSSSHPSAAESMRSNLLGLLYQHQPSKSLQDSTPLPPLQLPAKIIKRFKGELIEAIHLFSYSSDTYKGDFETSLQGKKRKKLLLQDGNSKLAKLSTKEGPSTQDEESVNEETETDLPGDDFLEAGDESEDFNSRRACSFVLITRSTKRFRQYEGCIFTSLTGALFFCQDNSENGWSFVDEASGVKLHNYRVKNGGSGFINPPGAHALYRDYLSHSRLEQAKNNRKYYQPLDVVQEMTETCSIDKVIQYLCRDRPELLRNLPDSQNQNSSNEK